MLLACECVNSSNWEGPTNPWYIEKIKRAVTKIVMRSESTDVQWEFRFVYSMSPLIQERDCQYGIKLGHYIELSYSRSLASTGLSGLMGQPGTKFSTNPGPTTISVEEGNFEPSPMWSQCQWLQTTASDLSEEPLVPKFDSSSPGMERSHHTQLGQLKTRGLEYLFNSKFSLHTWRTSLNHRHDFG